MSPNQRKNAIVAAAFIYSAVAHVAIFAGESPMTDFPVQAINSPAVQPEQVRNAHDRAECIKTLSEVTMLAGRNKLSNNAQVLHNAIQRLASAEAIELLVEQIGYPDVDPPGIDRQPARMSFSQLGPFAMRLPAVAALIEIGEPSVDRVIAKLLTTKSDIEFNACIVVIQRIDKPSAKKKLDRALAEVPSELKARVTLAMEDKETIESYFENIQRASRAAFPQHWSPE
jgi:hypothetical protein